MNNFQYLQLEMTNHYQKKLLVLWNLILIQNVVSELYLMTQQIDVF